MKTTKITFVALCALAFAASGAAASGGLRGQQTRRLNVLCGLGDFSSCPPVGRRQLKQNIVQQQTYTCGCICESGPLSTCNVVRECSLEEHVANVAACKASATLSDPKESVEEEDVEDTPPV